ncbi:hypothetical protein GGS21DRAFT_330914 [Xylaria nigripes]|nr:hypothetical protein GGS21DRAFT_330914 [Xylaria nigripes]
MSVCYCRFRIVEKYSRWCRAEATCRVTTNPRGPAFRIDKYRAQIPLDHALPPVYRNVASIGRDFEAGEKATIRLLVCFVYHVAATHICCPITSLLTKGPSGFGSCHTIWRLGAENRTIRQGLAIQMRKHPADISRNACNGKTLPYFDMENPQSVSHCIEAATNSSQAAATQSGRMAQLTVTAVQLPEAWAVGYTKQRVHHLPM